MARKIIIESDEEEELADPPSEVQESDDEAEAVDVEDEHTMPDDEEIVEAEEDEMFSDTKEDELDEEEGSDLDALSSPPENTAPPTPQPKLKIKLKLPAALSTATTASPTPSASRAASRRGASRDIDIESEDSDEESIAPSNRALTARQAVLRNVVDSSHVSLEEPPNPRKKKPLTEIEIALKREETARKRKNLSEKKLEDEKAETINRLLKKQSRAKGKRNALSTAEDRPTPLNSTVNNVADLDADENGDTIMVPEPIIPTMYRWISSAKPITPGPKSGNKNETDTRVMTLSFSVPKYVLPQAQTPDPAAMEVDKLPAAPTPTVTPIRTIPQCDIHGCGEKRKYRLVKDWQKGACGMAHLRELEDAFIAGKIH